MIDVLVGAQPFAADTRRLGGVRVLVTGGAGFIGSHVVDRFCAAGAEVAVLDDFSTGTANNLRAAAAAGLPQARVWRCDVRSGDAARLVDRWRPAVVVHLAAQVGVGAAAAAPAWDADVNIRGTLNLLDACVSAGVTGVVFAASSAVYGCVARTGLPVAESQPLAPATPYAMSKATALTYLNWYGRVRGLPWTALVLANVYGRRQSPTAGGVVARFGAALQQGLSPCIAGDGEQTRDFVHVCDVADAFVAAAARPGCGLVNIGTGVQTSVLRLYELASAAARQRVTPVHGTPVAGETRWMALSADRAARVLGWRPRTALADGLHALLAPEQVLS